MLLKKENKHLFQNSLSIQKHTRASSSNNKRSLIKIHSTNKLPQDFFKGNEGIVKTPKSSLKNLPNQAQIPVTNSLLFTFKPVQSQKFCQSAPQTQYTSLKLMKKYSSAANDLANFKPLKKSIALRKNQSQKQLLLQNRLRRS